MTPRGPRRCWPRPATPTALRWNWLRDSSTSASVLLVLQIIQQNLADVGIQAEIVSYDEASWLDTRNSGEMNSFVATWTADYNDPDNFIYNLLRQRRQHPQPQPELREHRGHGPGGRRP